MNTALARRVLIGPDELVSLFCAARAFFEGSDAGGPPRKRESKRENKKEMAATDKSVTANSMAITAAQCGCCVADARSAWRSGMFRLCFSSLYKTLYHKT